MSGSGSESALKGSQLVVGAGRTGFGGNVDGGSGGGMDRGGGGEAEGGVD